MAYRVNILSNQNGTETVRGVEVSDDEAPDEFGAVQIALEKIKGLREWEGRSVVSVINSVTLP